LTFETVPEAGAPEAVARHYETDRAAFGHVPAFTEAFSLRPEIYAAWRQLNGAIKAGMDLRRYELATLAAARRLRSSYCMLAHGTVLADQFLGAAAVQAIASDHRAAGLDEVDVAVMDLAEKRTGGTRGSSRACAKRSSWGARSPCPASLARHALP
jgi:alkylhydroperoxidase family enzyme